MIDLIGVTHKMHLNNSLRMAHGGQATYSTTKKTGQTTYYHCKYMATV